MQRAGRTQALLATAKTWCSAVVEPALSVLFPPRCVGCGDFETHLCDACAGGLEAIGADHCPRCGEPGPRPLVGGRCGRCMGDDLVFSGARAAFRHHGVARRLVAEFKFGGQPVLGRIMVDLARPVFADYVASISSAGGPLVTWVPSHRSVQRRRGYNQAELLARGLAGGVRPLPLAALVRKTTATRHQKALGKAGRSSNLGGVFAPAGDAADRVPEDTGAIVLIDDVYTTGATAREVSSVLVSRWRLPVYVFTFSRAVAGVTERHD